MDAEFWSFHFPFCPIRMFFVFALFLHYLPVGDTSCYFYACIATSLLRCSSPLTPALLGRALAEIATPTIHCYFAEAEPLLVSSGVQAPWPLDPPYVCKGYHLPPSTPERFAFVMTLREYRRHEHARTWILPREGEKGIVSHKTAGPRNSRSWFVFSFASC